jgi:hypothetical protein
MSFSLVFKFFLSKLLDFEIIGIKLKGRLMEQFKTMDYFVLINQYSAGIGKVPYERTKGAERRSRP